MSRRISRLQVSIFLAIALVFAWAVPKPWKDSTADPALLGHLADAGSPFHLPSWLPLVGYPSNDASNKTESRVNTAPGDDKSIHNSDDNVASGSASRYLPYWLRPGRQSVSSHDTLIMYSYYETNNAFENAAFFIKHGLHGSARFIFILMGESPLLDAILPSAANIETYRRNNTCFDLGAYGEVIQEKGLLASPYKKFILLNASIRGPFLPTWSKDCWSTTWLSKISSSVKLQGMSANCFPQFHIQSMIMGTDKEGLKSMVDDGTFNCANNMQEAVNQEVAMASKVMSHEWEVNAWLTALHGDKSYENRLTCVTSGNNDHLFEGSYFGFDVHPYETIFVKANRNVNPVMLGKMTEWHDRMNYSSYDYC